jgi:hypothetical protein
MSRRAMELKPKLNEAGMIRIALICTFLAACAGARPSEAGPELSFIPLDSSFKSAPRQLLPIIALDEKELMAAPAFKAVGIVQLEGKETRQLKAFFDAVAEAGAQVGCDVLFQRDAFELGTRVQKPMLPGANGPQSGSVPIGAWIASNGTVWHRNDRLVWQFVCGVTGASDEEQAKTLKDATFLAIQLRRKALGIEPCDPYIPTGSHVLHRDVCSNDKGKRNVADGGSTNSGW